MAKEREETQRDLSNTQEEARKLAEALENVAEYWNRRDNATAMDDALYHMIEIAETAVTAYRAAHPKEDADAK